MRNSCALRGYLDEGTQISSEPGVWSLAEDADQPFLVFMEPELERQDEVRAKRKEARERARLDLAMATLVPPTEEDSETQLFMQLKALKKFDHVLEFVALGSKLQNFTVDHAMIGLTRLWKMFPVIEKKYRPDEGGVVPGLEHIDDLVQGTKRLLEEAQYVKPERSATVLRSLVMLKDVSPTFLQLAEPVENHARLTLSTSSIEDQLNMIWSIAQLRPYVPSLVNGLLVDIANAPANINSKVRDAQIKAVMYALFKIKKEDLSFKNFEYRPLTLHKRKIRYVSEWRRSNRR